ncbi:MAG: acyl-ACP--UDP-N-acetylglucosamine O-acyltransferase [Hyphomonadaceae bacterium]
MADIHSSSVVSPEAEIADDVIIGPFCVVGPDVVIGASAVLHNGVTVEGRTVIGEGCELFTGAVIGKTPQILGFEDSPVSRIEIGARTIIREHATIHPGSAEQGGLTQVGTDCLLMIGVHIAHDCIIGDRCVLANNVTLGGHVHIGEQVWMGGLAAVHQHCRIGEHAFIGGGAILVDNVIPYGAVIGNHAHLAGINIVGLRRRGFSRQSIHDLRSAYRMLFADEGTFAERIDDTQAAFGGSDEVARILTFIEKNTARPLCMPN